MTNPRPALGSSHQTSIPPPPMPPLQFPPPGFPPGSQHPPRSSAPENFPTLNVPPPNLPHFQLPPPGFHMSGPGPPHIGPPPGPPPPGPPPPGPPPPGPPPIGHHPGPPFWRGMPPPPRPSGMASNTALPQQFHLSQLPPGQPPSHHASPRHASPHHASPRHAHPRHASPRHAHPHHDYAPTGQVPPSPMLHTPQFNPRMEASRTPQTSSKQLIPSSDNTSQKSACSQTEQDQGWINDWLIRKKITLRLKEKSHKKTVSIQYARDLLREAVTLMTDLEGIMGRLHGHDLDATQLEGLQQQAHQAQCRLQEIRSEFEEGDLASQLAERTKKIKKKRERIKRLRRESYMAKQTALDQRAVRHEELDRWQNELQQKEVEIKRAKEMKVVADETLAEVRRKVTDAKRSLETLKALLKLRQLRCEAAVRKGVQVSEETQSRFEDGIKSLKQLLRGQLKIYEDEQRTLQVMLDHESEEMNEVELARKQQRDRERLQRRERQINRLLFGSIDMPDDLDEKLAPFREYYSSAEKDFGAFITLRHDWDLHLVPEGTPSGSRMPAGWVYPAEPSSAAWASALKDNQPP